MLHRTRAPTEERGDRRTRAIAVLIIAAVLLATISSSWRMKSPVVWYAAMLPEEWELYQPILDEFTEKTGTQVQVELYGGTGMASWRISPARRTLEKGWRTW